MLREDVGYWIKRVRRLWPVKVDKNVGSLIPTGSITFGQTMNHFSIFSLFGIWLAISSSVWAEDQPLKEWNDVTFAEPETGALALDVIRPDDGELRPAVLCLHGGFWVKGTRKNIRPLAEEFAKRGYVGVASSYRLTGVAPYPAQIDDTRAAIRYLRENAAKYGIDPDRIGVTGSSAGGFLAVLAATENSSEAIERPNAAVGMGAQSELTATHLQNVDSGKSAENWTRFMGGIYRDVPGNYAAASPLKHLSGDDVPVAIVCGEFDHESTRAERFRQEAFRLGIATGLTVIPGAPHGLLAKEEHRTAAVDAVDAFFQKYLGTGKTGRVPMGVESEEGVKVGIEPLAEEWLRLGGGYSGCEGVQWLKPEEGREAELIFAAHHDRLLFRWSESGGLRLWKEGTPETSSIRPAKEGMVALEQTTRRLVRMTSNNNEVEVLAEQFEGKRLNRPNDLRIRPGKGTVWFTDPNYLFRQRPLETQELPGQWVFRYDPSVEGEEALTAPIRDLAIPNGIAFNGSGTRLFVGDSRAGKVMGYDIAKNGQIVGEPEVVASFSKGIDGISHAPDGRLWVATRTGVSIITQQGQTVGFLPMPGPCTSTDFVADGDFHWVALSTREAAHVVKMRFAEAK